MPKSTFFYNEKRLGTDKYISLKDEIKAIFDENKGRYGYRRITLALKKRGIRVNRKTVRKCMNELGIAGITAKARKYSSYKGDIGKKAPNIINREFEASEPMEKLFTDVTEFKICEQKVYLSPIIDSYNGEVVAYDISLSPNFKQIVNMLSNLYANNAIKENVTTLHSDQGWQYCMDAHHNNLIEHGIVQSMSRKGNCIDNAIAEGFFGKLKMEFFYCNKFESVDIFIKELKNYIDYYNNKRIKFSLGGMSPVEYRMIHAA